MASILNIFLIGLFVVLNIFETKGQTEVKNKITRTDYVHGIKKRVVYELRNDSIYITWYSLKDKPSKNLLARALSLTEADALKILYSEIDIASMEGSYSNEHCKSDSHKIYNISIGNASKNIYLFCRKQETLTKIDEFLFPISSKIIEKAKRKYK